MFDDSGAAPSVVETHISTLVFAGDRVYKRKKPVTFGFVDFASVDRRREACHREVALNRRLSPDVYLGVADFIDERGCSEPMVVMRRMDPRQRLAALVQSADPDLDHHLDALGALVAGFHRRAGRSGNIDAAGTAGAVRAVWDEGTIEMTPFVGEVLDPTRFDDVVRRYRRFIDGRSELFGERVAAGWVRDGHGDLQAEDVFCTPDGPRVLDCIEFDDRLRHADVLADIAFLAMDLERLGDLNAARRVVDAWAADVGVGAHHGPLLHFYVAARAQVRAKVACLRYAQQAADAPDGPQARASADAARTLLDLCATHLHAAAVRLVLVGGSPGTGKTTVATRVGEATGWPVLHSDVVRKQRFGLDPHQRPTPEVAGSMYDPAEVSRTYAGLIDAAGDLLRHGQSVIVDASWTSEVERQRARHLAEVVGVDVIELRCVCDDEVAHDRITRRLADTPTGPAGSSDATVAVAGLLAGRADPWPTATSIDTSGASERAGEAALGVLGPW